MAERALPAITGLVLAGGRGSRMGGVDKGLQDYNGVPLAAHALQRLSPQVDRVALSANRHFDRYATLGVPVWADATGMTDGADMTPCAEIHEGIEAFAGPLAGFLAGLEHCETPWLLAVPCDSPRFPLDLAARMAETLHGADAEIAMAHGLDDGMLRPQPVFCLMRTTVLPGLRRFMAMGQRRVGTWTALHRTIAVPFDRPGDDPRAFANANTLAELRALEEPRMPPRAFSASDSTL